VIKPNQNPTAKIGICCFHGQFHVELECPLQGLQLSGIVRVRRQPPTTRLRKARLGN
jgi:hypothetical protein